MCTGCSQPAAGRQFAERERERELAKKQNASTWQTKREALRGEQNTDYLRSMAKKAKNTTIVWKHQEPRGQFEDQKPTL